ncbi:hypothetical protein PhCBS80983_g05300 [Powellomyces hirtus]|uniref:Ras-GEF domain-containing protein n=1 Tax=Powellomyces hirtus TaxID=109895 RepID=A0A507DWX4_9FUNG|nr:hypothetical protein PhCBS80983_g05300 [Powellomyces hirtus]
MPIGALVAEGNADALRAFLAENAQDEATLNQQSTSDGKTPLHVAASTSLECVEVLLAQPSIKVDSQDSTGSTPLHLAAAASELGIVKRLIEAGGNVRAVNVHGNRPIDYAKSTEVHAYLTEQMAATPVPPQRKSSHLIELEAELPQEIESLRALCIDLIVSQSVFQARCKETIRQLIEEKHVALHKNRLLEQAAGIQDKETSERFIDQLHYFQDQNEKQANTIAYLETSIQLFEYAAAQQDEYYRKNMTDLTKQHNEQLQAIFRRNAETEKAFLAYQTAHSEDLAELARLRIEVESGTKSKSGTAKGAAGSLETALQAEVHTMRKDMATLVAEKLTLEERLKLNEKLKAMSEAENVTLRDDMGKLRKLMQEEVVKQMHAAREEQDEMDESSGNILFNRGEGGQKRLKGGAPEKLLERLMDPTVHDHHYQQTILLTHTMFISTKQLLDSIIAKYREVAADKSDEMRLESPILLRIINLLKFWIEHHWADFADDPALKDTLESFIKESFEDGKMGSGLRIAFAEKVVKESALDMAPSTAPKPILPKALAKRYSMDSGSSSTMSNRTTLLMGMNIIPMERPNPWTPFGGKSKVSEGSEEIKLKLLDFEPLELARQLTLMEFELFKAIRSREYLDLAWMKETKETEAPNILRMTRWSNHVVQWIVTEIVSVKDTVKSRAAAFERVVMLGQALSKLRNFNGVKEIVAALQTASVYRLKKTKEAIGSKYMRTYDELVRLVSSELNYKNMRAKIRDADPPLIPFPGLYQGDLVFLDTCQKNKLEGGSLINYHKLESIARSLMELEAYQQVSYPLEPVPEIQEYIRSYQLLDDDQAYNASLLCEPKAS